MTNGKRYKFLVFDNPAPYINIIWRCFTLPFFKPLLPLQIEVDFLRIQVSSSNPQNWNPLTLNFSQYYSKAFHQFPLANAKSITKEIEWVGAEKQSLTARLLKQNNIFMISYRYSGPARMGEWVGVCWKWSGMRMVWWVSSKAHDKGRFFAIKHPIMKKDMYIYIFSLGWGYKIVVITG